MPLVDCVCARCGESFAIKQSVARRGRGKFCSIDCSAKTFVESNSRYKPLAIGDRFHMLVLIRPVSLGRNPTWRVRCDCGKEKVTRASRFRGMRPLLSCGCYRLPREPNANSITRHPLYGIWSNMKNRSTNKKDHLYAGRGIRVCQRWLYGDGVRGGFDCFLMDVGPRPSIRHSLDRINNDGNYEPGNVRWATPKEQARNTRKNIFVTINGKRMCLMDAVSESGTELSYACVLARVYKGWPVADAMFRPKHAGKPLRNRA
jgi:hypothetical protein